LAEVAGCRAASYATYSGPAIRDSDVT